MLLDMDIDGTHPRKRQRIAYHHKHVQRHGIQKVPTKELGTLSLDVFDTLMFQSIKVICEEQAWKQKIEEPMIESVALEALRSMMDEFTKRFCSRIQQSMLAARRTVPIACDFESAFLAMNVPHPIEQLSAYHVHSSTNPPLLPTPPPEDEFHNPIELPSTFLGPELSKQDELKKFGFNTAALPPLPSAHTYKDTPVFSHREKDSRRVRELATDEGKLGEQALRKLAGAVKVEAAMASGLEDHTIIPRHTSRRKQPVLTEEAAFEETMRDLLRNEGGEFELGPIVSSEKSYRMPDEVRIKRKLAGPKTSTMPKLPTKASTSKYNVLPPPTK